jgi:DegV family protein with EDD domain
MKSVAVITDTISGISREVAEEYDVDVVPLHVVVDGASYLDTDVDKRELYELLAGRTQLPTTSAATAAQYLEAYRRVSKKARAIVHICYTSWIGMGYKEALQAVNMARRELPATTIEAIDSRTEHGAQLLCVLEAAKAIADGKGFTEVVDMVNALVPRLNQLYILDTPFYLARGGRMGKAGSWVESAIGVKPILELDWSTGGAMSPVTRARTKARALDKALAILKQRNNRRKAHVVISHDDAPDDALRLRDEIRSQVPGSEVRIAGVSPVTIVHNGPGAIRLGWYSE